MTGDGRWKFYLGAVLFNVPFWFCVGLMVWISVVHWSPYPGP